MNRVVKQIAESMLIMSQAERVSRARFWRRSLILAYHNVLPEGQSPVGDRSLHLRQRDFAMQLDALAKTHDIVSISDLFAAPLSERPRAIITFDDAYAGAVTAGVTELTRRNLPATIFVSPGLIGSVTWWDTVADCAGGTIPNEARRYALETMKGDTQRVIDWAKVDARRDMAPSNLPGIATIADLTGVASLPGITFGSHTWSHPNLSALAEAEIESELSRPLEWLRSRFSNVVPWLTYPYGLFNDASRRIAARLGYTGAMRIDGGWLPRGAKVDLFAVPRLNIPSGLSVNGFRLRIAGL